MSGPRAFGCSVVSVRAKEENRFVPTEEELRFLVMRSDLVFLGCPNNPTGCST